MKENTFKRTILIPTGISLTNKGKDRHYDIYANQAPKLISDLNGFRDEIKKQSFENKNDTVELVRTISWEKWKTCFISDRKQNPIKFFNEYNTKVSPEIEIEKRKKGELNEMNPDCLSAELASLYLLYEQNEQVNLYSTDTATSGLEDEIILLASDTDEGLYCACFLANYLKHKEPYKSHTGEVHVECINGLKGEDSKSFEKGIDNLITQTTELIQKRQQSNREFHLIMTGGYKGVLPYLALLGLAYSKMDVFYLFEFSSEIICLPKLPVGFDLLTWRNYRAFIHSIPHIEILEEKDLEALIPDTMRMLLERKKV